MMSDIFDLMEGASYLWADDTGLWIKDSAGTKVCLPFDENPSERDLEIMAAVDAAIAEFRTSDKAMKISKASD
jgi:hypothetical protein